MRSNYDPVRALVSALIVNAIEVSNNGDSRERRLAAQWLTDWRAEDALSIASCCDALGITRHLARRYLAKLLKGKGKR